MSENNHDFEENLNVEDRDALKAYMAEHRHATKEEAQQKIAEAKKERQAMAAGQVEVEDESRKERKQRNRRKSNQYAIIAAVIVVIIVAFFGMHLIQEKAKAKTLAGNVATAKTELADHYLDQAKVYPKKAASTSELKALKAAITKTKDDAKAYSALKVAYTTYAEKNEALKKVNDLYTTAVIKGKERMTGTLAAQTKSIPQNYGETDGFYKLLNQALAEAKLQLEDTENAQKVVAALFDNTKVKTAVTRESYQQAVAAVEKVKNSETKSELTKQLATVDQSLKSAEAKAAAEKAQAEKAAAEKAAAAKKAAEEKAATEKAQAEIASRAGTGTSIMKANQSQINDTSNPAWTWNSGVLEKVIQTSVARGYITADGYLLRKNSIVNGEGYYDLYATNLNSTLMKQFSEKELPVYLFTINDKTGWFKGNGPK